MKETWDNNCIIPLYDNTNQVCGIIHNDSAYYFLKNLQGDVIAITDDAGNTVARYKYDAWGECTIEWANCAIGVINPFRYRTYYYDNETGFYYLNSRYYDPKICRFINADDARYVAKMESNTFVYCCNDSINKEDPNGNKSRNLYIITGQGCGHHNYQIRAAFEDYFDDIGDEVNFVPSNHIFAVNDYDEFYNAWDSLPLKTDIVVIDCHAAPISLGLGGNLLKRFQPTELPRRIIRVLILLGCNCGLSYCKDGNIAVALANVTSGVVVASDGTVTIDTFPMDYDSGFSATSNADSNWRYYNCEYGSSNYAKIRTQNDGWVLYSKDYTPKYTNLKTLTIPDIMGLINAYGFYDYL